MSVLPAPADVGAGPEEPSTVTIARLSLRFEHRYDRRQVQQLEAAYARHMHRSLLVVDFTWSFFHLFIALLLFFKHRPESESGAAETMRQVCLTLCVAGFRLPAFALAYCLSRKHDLGYGRTRRYAVTAVKLHRAASYVALWRLVPTMSCGRLGGIAFETWGVNLVSPFVSALQFRHHLAFHSLQTVISLCMVLADDGLCSSILNRAAAPSGGSCSDRLARMDTGWRYCSYAMGWLPRLAAPPPALQHDVAAAPPLGTSCKAYLAFLSLLVGWVAPTTALYFMELASRRAFLASRGLTVSWLPPGWLPPDAGAMHVCVMLVCVASALFLLLDIMLV